MSSLLSLRLLFRMRHIGLGLAVGVLCAQETTSPSTRLVDRGSYGPLPDSNPTSTAHEALLHPGVRQIAVPSFTPKNSKTMRRNSVPLDMQRHGATHSASAVASPSTSARECAAESETRRRDVPSGTEGGRIAGTQ